jgi:nucleotide-binding universal stress UspA family protein
MRPWQSLLCPLDYSENSRRALRWAAALAGQTGARLKIVHVTDTVLASAASSRGLDPLDEAARGELGEFVCSALPRDASWLPPPALDLRVGTPHEQILASAREDASDLIVMGTHGWSGYRKLLFGSTTERVLRETTIPVIAVPLGEREGVTLGDAGPVFDVRSIVAAIDPAPGARDLLRYAARVAEVLAVPILLVHVVPQVHAPARWQSALEAEDRIARARALRQLQALASEAIPREHVDAVVEVGQPADGIAAIAAERDAGLIILGLKSGTGLLAPRPGSIAYRVLGLAKVPVLVVPPRLAETGS